MSEMISSIINGVKDRTSGIYGYLATSFCLFNWSNIYYLIASEKTAEQKIVSLSLSFSFIWNAFAPFITGVILCLITPFISSAIKEVHKQAIWWSKRIEFKNDNYSQILIENRKFDLEEKRKESSRLELKLSELSKRLTNAQELYNTINDKNSKLKSEESILLAKIASKTDELQKLEIKITKENQEHRNFKEIKDSYDTLVNKTHDEILEYQIKIDKILGILKSLIDGGYTPEVIENTILSQLQIIGIDIPTKNPLRKNPREHVSSVIYNGKENKIIGHSPDPVEMPSKEAVDNGWPHD